VKLLHSILILILFSCSNSFTLKYVPVVGPGTETVSPGDYIHVWYISVATGSDEYGIGSAQKPWGSLSLALNKIEDTSPGQRQAIFVAAGIYANTPIRMKNYVDLWGGFDPQTWGRDIHQYRTVLTGNEEQRVVIGVDHARLDGFVITNGQVRGKGAGLWCDGVSPTITNNFFVGNRTLTPVPWNPKYLHEIANDGGAVYCENGAAPIIMNNLFVQNKTENGRGAAIAFYKNCNGKIANNVFMNNVTGLNDPMRSSDGGAISIFDWSRPEIEHNIILNNQALAHNDGGGMFVALWSSPIISNNIFVGNQCGDDAGALFIGGQEHRYDRPLDPLPGAEKFFVAIENNIFIGNSNPSKNSGAMRFTMESRGRFRHNIVAHNSGIYFQRSEVAVEDNIILDDFLFVETKQGLKPGIIRNNQIWADFNLETEATVANNNLKNPREGNYSSSPDFKDDWIELHASAAIYHPWQFVTSILVTNGKLAPNELVNRVVKAGDRWGVIKSNSERDVEIWGDFSGEILFTTLPSYRLQ